MRYLGKRYDVVMKCIRHGDKFTAHEIGVNPQTMKGLADDGYLLIVEKAGLHPRRPYTYLVPDKVRQCYE